MIAKIYTSRDAAKAHDAKVSKLGRERIIDHGRPEVAEILIANPDIGILIRKGKPVYYTNNPYREAANPADLVEA